MAKPSSRTISFFKLVAKDEDDKRVMFEELISIFQKAKELSEQMIIDYPSAKNGFVEIGDHFLHMKGLEISDDRIYGRLGYARRDDIPLILRGTKVGPIPLDPKDFIYDPTHFTIYRNGAFLIEWNFFGPKQFGFREYLTKFSSEHEELKTIESIEIIRISRGDRAELIKSLEQIRSIKLKVAFAEVLPKDISNNPFGALLKTARDKIRGTSEIEMKFSVGRGRGKGSLDITSDEISDMLEAFGNSASSYVILGIDKDTGIKREIDLVKMFITARKSVAKDGISRTINSSSMKVAMNEAYSENKSSVEKALR